jgi:uncharacterized membrane protein
MVLGILLSILALVLALMGLMIGMFVHFMEDSKKSTRDFKKSSLG